MKDLIEFARTFHGHICPGLALGMRASQIALQRLGIERASLYDTINEDIVAIVENNNCFADGVQIVTGCTFGNNSLIYHDLGKNAVTVVKGGEGVRVYIDYERIDDLFDDEAKRLFEKVIVRREGSEEEQELLVRKWEEIALAVLELDEGRFDVRSVSCAVEKAPIFASVRCSKCGEVAMETRTRSGVCLSCLGEFYAVIGRGIVKFRGRYEEVIS